MLGVTYTVIFVVRLSSFIGLFTLAVCENFSQSNDVAKSVMSILEIKRPIDLVIFCITMSLRSFIIILEYLTLLFCSNMEKLKVFTYEFLNISASYCFAVIWKNFRTGRWLCMSMISLLHCSCQMILIIFHLFYYIRCNYLTFKIYVNSALFKSRLYLTLCYLIIQLMIDVMHLYSVNRMGRDMAYDCWSCDLLCAASSSDLYRINLEQVCSCDVRSILLPSFYFSCITDVGYK